MDDALNSNPEILQKQSPEKGAELRREQSAEQGPDSESNLIAGAQMLEAPADGNFVHGLQVFIAWVKSIVADKK